MPKKTYMTIDACRLVKHLPSGKSCIVDTPSWGEVVVPYSVIGSDSDLGAGGAAGDGGALIVSEWWYEKKAQEIAGDAAKCGGKSGANSAAATLSIPRATVEAIAALLRPCGIEVRLVGAGTRAAMTLTVVSGQDEAQGAPSADDAPLSDEPPAGRETQVNTDDMLPF